MDFGGIINIQIEQLNKMCKDICIDNSQILPRDIILSVLIWKYTQIPLAPVQ